MRIPIPSCVRQLLPAALLLLTPACLSMNSWAEKDSETESLTLTPAESHAEARLHVVAAPRAGKRAKLSSINLNVDMEQSWQPQETDVPAVQPWYRVRLVDERDGHVAAEDILALTEPNKMYLVGLRPEVGLGDKEIERFEATYRLEFDRQGPPSEGPIQIGWKAHLSALTHEDDVKDIEVTLAKP